MLDLFERTPQKNNENDLNENIKNYQECCPHGENKKPGYQRRTRNTGCSNMGWEEVLETMWKELCVGHDTI